MRRTITCTLIAAAGLAATVGAGPQAGPAVLDLGPLTPTSWATAINNAGVIGGTSGFQTPDQIGFLRQQGVAVALPPLVDGVGSYVTGINNRGQAVGASQNADGTAVPVIWESGAVRPLDVPPRTVSGVALAINDAGIAVGVVQLDDHWFGEQRAVLWTRGVVQDLGPEFVAWSGGFSSALAINNRGQIVGQIGTGDAYLWERGRWQVLGTLGGNGAIARAINDRGQVVGTSQTADGRYRAFLWDRGRMRELGTLSGGVHSVALGINNRGEVVGQSEVAVWPGGAHAFLWKDGTMFDLWTPGLHFERAEAINERGDIVGLGFDPSGDKRAVLWTRAAGKGSAR
jgi:probable HAF family extracellular repeat protein